jgi:tRNA (guanine37-N1)-methyltransferase
MPPMLKESLRGVLDPNEIAQLSSAVDLVGNIAIVKIPDVLETRQELIAEQILEHMKNITTVLKQSSDVQGEYRTRDLEFVAGEEKYETIYKESNCRFRVNLRSVYFSPRLSTERLRICEQVKDGELVFNMFAGLGTFSVIIAKNKRCIVDSVDKNPEAIRLAFETLKLNKKLKGIVRPVLADAADHASSHLGTYDRVLMPLPERASEFLPAAMASTKNEEGPIVHYYVHVPQDDFKNSDWIAQHLERVASNSSRRFEVLKWKKVREVGPKFIQAVADVKMVG